MRRIKIDEWFAPPPAHTTTGGPGDPISIAAAFVRCTLRKVALQIDSNGRDVAKNFDLQEVRLVIAKSDYQEKATMFTELKSALKSDRGAKKKRPLLDPLTWC